MNIIEATEWRYDQLLAEAEVSKAVIVGLVTRLAEVEKERDFVRSIRPAQRRITELEDELAMCRVSNQDYKRAMTDLETRLDEAEWRSVGL